jgi:hypothetical protein
VDDVVHLKPEATRLVAIATEWWAEQGALVGTRIGVVLDGLRTRYPDLQAFIPPTEGWVPTSVRLLRRQMLPVTPVLLRDGLGTVAWARFGWGSAFSCQFSAR